MAKTARGRGHLKISKTKGTMAMPASVIFKLSTTGSLAMCAMMAWSNDPLENNRQAVENNGNVTT